MPDDIWDAFPETVEVTQGKRPMKRPSEKDLDAAERALGLEAATQLPQLRRAVRGGHPDAGGLSLRVEFWAPGNPKNRFNSSLEERNNPYRAISPADWRRTSTEPVRASRLVYFAESPLSLNNYGWDPEDEADPDAYDYGIYAFNSRSELKLLPRVADSFADFIMGYCLDRHPGSRPIPRPEWKKFGSMRSYHRH